MCSTLLCSYTTPIPMQTNKQTNTKKQLWLKNKKTIVHNTQYLDMQYLEGETLHGKTHEWEQKKRSVSRLFCDFCPHGSPSVQRTMNHIVNIGKTEISVEQTYWWFLSCNISIPSLRMAFNRHPSEQCLEARAGKRLVYRYIVRQHSIDKSHRT